MSYLEKLNWRRSYAHPVDGTQYAEIEGGVWKRPGNIFEVDCCGVHSPGLSSIIAEGLLHHYFG